MHRFFSEKIEFSDHTISVNEKDIVTQIVKVLKLQPGERFILFDKEYEYVVEVRDTGKKSVTTHLVERRHVGSDIDVDITLYVSLLKKDNFEHILQKGTEVGVTTFVPVIAQRSISRDISPNKYKRYKKIIIEAVEQSGGVRIPELRAPISFKEAVKEADSYDQAVILHTDVTETLLKNAILKPKKINRVALFIGPEGGFTPKEIDTAVNCCVEPAGLGTKILRAETAAVTAAAITAHLLQ